MANVYWEGDDVSNPTVYTTAANWQGGSAPVATNAVIFPDGCTNAVAGSDQNATALASFETRAGYSGTVGSITAGNPTALEIAATTCTLAGSGLSYIDLTANSTSTCSVSAAGTTVTTGLYGLHLSSADAISVLNIDLDTNQSVGVAALAGTVGEFTTVNISGKGTVTLGSGLTCTTLNIRGSGIVYNRASIANVTVVEGTPAVYLEDATAISTALIVQGGTVYEQSSGTKTQVTVFFPANIVCSLPKTRTWTNTTIYGDGGLDDAEKSVTFTNPIKDYGSGTNIVLGSNKTIARGSI